MSNNVLASASFSRRNWYGVPEWIKHDGLLSVRGRQFHQRWIHQTPVYVARLPLQAHLQGTAALFTSLRYHVRTLSACFHCFSKKVSAFHSKYINQSCNINFIPKALNTNVKYILILPVIIPSHTYTHIDN